MLIIISILNDIFYSRNQVQKHSDHFDVTRLDINNQPYRILNCLFSNYFPLSGMSYTCCTDTEDHVNNVDTSYGQMYVLCIRCRKPVFLLVKPMLLIRPYVVILTHSLILLLLLGLLAKIEGIFFHFFFLRLTLCQLLWISKQCRKVKSYSFIFPCPVI